jgi:serine/threonine protein kinase
MSAPSSSTHTPLEADLEPNAGTATGSWGFAEGDEIVPGRYALEELGGGHQYEAWLAWDEPRACLVVAKIVRPNLVEDDLVMAGLRREAELLARLAHPVIVRGFCAVLDGPRPHVVMEHLEGPPLSTTLRRFGPLSVDQLLPLAFQLATALRYLANERVVHLDVKPRNVILGVPPRLIDLSVARSFDDAAAITRPIGTDAYMAPEQCRPDLAPIAGPTDVWGLGATLHHAIAGEVPFPRDEDFDEGDELARFPQLEGFPERLPESCPQELELLVLDCLEPDPSARPTPQDVANALEPLIEGLRGGRILGRSRPRIL